MQGRALVAQLVQCGLYPVGLVQAEQGEFLAAQAAQQHLRKGRGQGAGEHHQGAVAAGMAEAVVDLLEVIEVEHRHADFTALALRLLQQLQTLLVEGAAVVQPGQRVELRGLFQRAQQVAALEGGHHPAVELLGAERLAQEVIGAVLDELRTERALGVGGYADDDQIVAPELLPQQLDQFEAADAGHGVVQHQQVDVRLLAEQAQGLLAVARLQNLVAVRGEDVADVVAGGVGVVGDQDLDMAVAVEPVQQAEGVFVGVLALLEHVIDHALGQQVVAPLLVVAAAEHDARQVIAHHQVDALAVGGVRQVQVGDGGEEQPGGGFQHHFGLAQGGAEHRLQIRFLAEQMFENLQHQRAVFDHQDIAHG